jgi:hypothetical protein
MVQVEVPISTRGRFNGLDLILILTKLWTFGLHTLEPNLYLAKEPL